MRQYDLFKKLKVDNWRQFGNLDIEFDNNIVILTGPNGCGKTTVLNILNKHFGWNLHFVSTPYLSKKQNKKLWSDFLSVYEKEPEIDYENNVKVGQIEYSTGTICSFFVPKNQSANYKLLYENQMAVTGLHIPSRYSRFAHLP